MYRRKNNQPYYRNNIKLRRIDIRLSEDSLSQLKELAEAFSTTRSELVRGWISESYENYMEKRKKEIIEETKGTELTSAEEKNEKLIINQWRKKLDEKNYIYCTEFSDESELFVAFSWSCIQNEWVQIGSYENYSEAVSILSWYKGNEKELAGFAAQGHMHVKKLPKMKKNIVDRSEEYCGFS